MAGRNADAVAARYAKLTEGLTAQEDATSSVPVSYQGTCFPELGETACITTSAYLPPSAENFVCSIDQGIDVETAWKNALPEGSDAVDVADRAAMHRVGELRAEMRRKLTQPDCD